MSKVACSSKVDNIKEFHCAVFEFKAPKAVIKGVLGGPIGAMVIACNQANLEITHTESLFAGYYGNLLCHGNNNMVTNDLAVF